MNRAFVKDPSLVTLANSGVLTTTSWLFRLLCGIE